MFVDSDGTNGTKFAQKLLSYLQRADYRLATTQEDRNQIFKSRYDAYHRVGSIEKNSSELFEDEYDHTDNCWIFSVNLDGEFASTIRFHLLTPENRVSPSMDVYPDILHPMLDQGMLLIDPTRFVTEPEIAKEHPEINFLTLRVCCMAYEHFVANYVLAAVKKEHIAFYRRVFNAKCASDPRGFPLLSTLNTLMLADVRKFRDKIARRYPIFESSLTERRLMFSQNNMPVEAITQNTEKLYEIAQ